MKAPCASSSPGYEVLLQYALYLAVLHRCNQPDSLGWEVAGAMGDHLRCLIGSSRAGRNARMLCYRAFSFDLEYVPHIEIQAAMLCVVHCCPLGRVLEATCGPARPHNGPPFLGAETTDEQVLWRHVIHISSRLLPQLLFTCHLY